MTSPEPQTHGYDIGDGYRRELARAPERILVLAAIAGDLSSFDELARRWRPAVASAVRGSTADEELREDVVQEVFLQAFRTLPQLRDPDAFPGWLRAIARRQARRRGRERQSHLRRFVPLDEVVLATCPALGEGPEALALARERSEHLSDALGELPPSLRETVELRFAADMQLQEIAAWQGITYDGVKWRLREALRRLREGSARIGAADTP